MKAHLPKPFVLRSSDAEIMRNALRYYSAQIEENPDKEYAHMLPMVQKALGLIRGSCFSLDDNDETAVCLALAEYLNAIKSGFISSPKNDTVKRATALFDHYRSEIAQVGITVKTL